MIRNIYYLSIHFFQFLLTVWPRLDRLLDKTGWILQRNQPERTVAYGLFSGPPCKGLTILSRIYFLACQHLCVSLTNCLIWMCVLITICNHHQLILLLTASTENITIMSSMLDICISNQNMQCSTTVARSPFMYLK